MYWITGILGISFAAAPFIFGYSENNAATLTSVILGTAIVFVSLVEGMSEKKGKWEYWVTAIVGLFSVVSPFLLGFGSVATAVWTSVGIGLILSLLAGYKLYFDQTSFR